MKVTHAIVSNTLKRSTELLRLDERNENCNIKRHRSVAFPLLETTLYEWIAEYESQVNINGDLIEEKTRIFLQRLI